MGYVAGIDIGTTTICACLMDADSGEVLKVKTIANRAPLPSSAPWEDLQDPSLIAQDCASLLAHLEQLVPVAGLGITGQMHGIVYMDAAGRPLGPLATWQDERGNQMTGDGTESYAARLSRIAGRRVPAGYGALTHYYNVLNGLVPPGAARFCTIPDFVAAHLSGRTAPLLHASMAASLGLFDEIDGTFDTRTLAAAGLDAALFPPVARGAAVLGQTPGGCAVSVAIGDNQASFAGAVRDAPNTLLVNIGTGSQISCRTPLPVQTPGTESRPYLTGDFLWVGAALCGGRAYALLEQFFRQVAAGAGANPPSLYSWMDRLAEQYAVLKEPLSVKPLFSGTRQDPALRGSIEGLSISNFTPAHLVSGLLLGTVEELVSFYERVLPKLPQKPTLLVGSGNGLRAGRIWRQMFEERLGMPMSVPKYKEEAAIGAALFSMAATGQVQSLSHAQSRIQYIDGN